MMEVKTTFSVMPYGHDAEVTAKGEAGKITIRYPNGDGELYAVLTVDPDEAKSLAQGLLTAAAALDSIP